MPSGAKKRKAAKKKKEQSANYPHGNDDPKSQDERDSDAGSPASQDDHNHHYPFSQGEDDGKRAQSDVTEEQSLKEATKDDKSTEKSRLDGVDIKIENGWEANKDLESTHVSVHHVEHNKDVGSNSAVETVVVDNSVPDEFESGLKENEEKILPTSNGIPGLEAKVFTSSDIPPTAETSNVAEKHHASEHHDNSEKQPPVVSTPPPSKTASSLSCCGLFEVFTGSRR